MKENKSQRERVRKSTLSGRDTIVRRTPLVRGFRSVSNVPHVSFLEYADMESVF